MKKNLLLFFAIITSITRIQAQAPFTLQRDVRIPMRDGITLSADIAIPKNTKQASVALIVNCYPTENGIVGAQYAITSAGYIYVEVANRGKAKSEGEFTPFVNDAQDNYDIIDWISKQSWCNGNVVMGGGSYLGFTQWAAAKMNHPALKAIAPMVAAAPGIDFPLANNIFSSYALRWLNYVTNNPYTDNALFENNKHWYSLYNLYHTKGLAFNKLDSLDNNSKEIFQEWLLHPSFDNYWSSSLPSTSEDFSAISIPVLTITGFFDGDQRGAFYYYNNHQKFNARAKDNHYLIIGPYDHFGAQSMPAKKYGDYVVDSTARIDMRFVCIDWFKHTLEGKSRPAIIKDKVNCFVLNSGWKHAASLDALAPDTLTLKLKANAKNAFNMLTKEETVKSEIISISFDASLKDTIDIGTQDSVYNYENTKSFSNEYLKKKQTIFFDSEPLQKVFDLIGSPVADLYLKFKGIKDCDLSLTFYEVTPDGKSYPLSQQYQRMSYLLDNKQRNLLSEDKIYQFKFDNTQFMGKRIASGSKIRLAISVINSPSIQKNYGSGRDVSEETIKDAQLGTIQVLMSKKQQSAIYLPGSKN